MSLTYHMDTSVSIMSYHMLSLRPCHTIAHYVIHGLKYVRSYNAMLYHIILCSTTASYHVHTSISYHIMSHQILPYYVLHEILYLIMLHIMSITHHILRYYILSLKQCHTVAHHVIHEQEYIRTYHAMLYHIILHTTSASYHVDTSMTYHVISHESRIVSYPSYHIMQ